MKSFKRNELRLGGGVKRLDYVCEMSRKNLRKKRNSKEHRLKKKMKKQAFKTKNVI